MDRTENYQLPKWEKTDRVMMEDFNDMTGKIDKGMAEEKKAREELGQTVAKCGNCMVVTGTYRGQARSDLEQFNKLTFDHKPLAVFIHPEAYIPSSMLTRLVLLAGSTFAYGYSGNAGSTVTVKWQGNSVLWSGGNATYRCDLVEDYRYVALLAMDAEA